MKSVLENLEQWKLSAGHTDCVFYLVSPFTMELTDAKNDESNPSVNCSYFGIQKKIGTVKNKIQ